MLLDFVKEKRRRESAQRYFKARRMGEIVLRAAREKPEFAAVVREIIRRSDLSDEKKAFVLEGIPEPR